MQGLRLIADVVIAAIAARAGDGMLTVGVLDGIACDCVCRSRRDHVGTCVCAVGR